LLAPRWRQIDQEWRRKAGRVSSAAHLDALAALNLGGYSDRLIAGDLDAFRETLARCGQALAGRGVGFDEVVASLALYLEGCLGALPQDSISPRRMASALLRLTAAVTIFAGAGYDEHREEDRRDLEEKVRATEQRLRNFSVHLINISEQDRSRLSRDLHDEIGHNLLVLKLYMEMIALDLKEGNTVQGAQKLDEAVELVGQAIEGVRRLAFNLGPAILDEMGFTPSFKRYARQFTARTGINVRVQTQRLPAKLPSSYEVAFYRVFQGALSNVAAHARARNVKVTLGTDRENVFLVVEDDGIGFDVARKLKEPEQAFGLMAMRQRIELLGGSIRAASRRSGAGAPRSGTRIEVNLPLMEMSANSA